MTEKSERTKKALIKATSNLIKANGNASTITLRQIAKVSKMSPSLIKYHFGDKAGLLDAVFRQTAPSGRLNPITQYFQGQRAILGSYSKEEKAAFLSNLIDFVASYFKEVRSTPWLQCIHTRVINVQKITHDDTVTESVDDVKSFCDIYRLVTGNDNSDEAVNWFLMIFVPLAFHICNNAKSPSLGSVLLSDKFDTQYIEFIKRTMLIGLGFEPTH